MSHHISEEQWKTVCKPGTRECCRFLTCGAGGFECAKLTELRTLLDFRVSQGQMNATGDNCEGL